MADDEISSVLESSWNPSHLVAVFALLIGVGCLCWGGYQLLKGMKPAPLPAFPTSLHSLAQASHSATLKVQINQADAAELESLPGIGAVRAQTILQTRPYTSLADMQSKTHFGATVMSQLSSYVQF